MKREPITIDVTPELLEVERPRERVSLPKQRIAPPRSPIAQMRDLEKIGRIVQRPNFWIGLVADLWMKGPR